MFNERCAEWVIYAPKAYVNVFFLFSMVSIAFIQGMFMLQRNYIVSICRYNCVLQNNRRRIAYGASALYKTLPRRC